MPLFPGRAVRITGNSTDIRKDIRGYIEVNGHWAGGYPYGCPHPLTIYTNISTDIHADVRVELSILRTVRPGLWQYFWGHHKVELALVCFYPVGKILASIWNENRSFSGKVRIWCGVQKPGLKLPPAACPHWEAGRAAGSWRLVARGARLAGGPPGPGERRGRRWADGERAAQGPRRGSWPGTGPRVGIAAGVPPPRAHAIVQLLFIISVLLIYMQVH